MTRSQLEQAFATYFSEMDKCKTSGCHLALLHIVVVLPNICAALESQNGEADGNAYKRWCGERLPSHVLSPDERWEMRCALVHEGKTLPDSRARYRYASYSFMPPGGGEIHQVVST